VFDLGGVLIAWRPQEIAEATFDDAEAQKRVVAEIFQSPLWREFDAGRLDEAAAVRAISRAAGFTEQEMRRLFSAYREALTPMPYAEALVRDLAKRGAALFVLSNINAGIMKHLKQRYDIWRPFRAVMASGEIGLLKPDAEIYEHFCRRYGLVPGDTVLIDDTPENISGARAVGMAGILFQSPEGCLAALDSLAGR
jgi:putative hydrolase of the HAD superfamily